jgi:metal-responsive CopG/Arc/MetJ family transcriptional regulator
LLKRLNKLAKNKRGFKTELMNYALQKALDEIKNYEKNKRSNWAFIFVLKGSFCRGY